MLTFATACTHNTAVRVQHFIKPADTLSKQRLIWFVAVYTCTNFVERMRVAAPCAHVFIMLQGHSAVLFKMKPRFYAAGHGILLLGLLVILGATMLHFTEGTDAVDGVYWAVSTLATVGEPSPGPASLRVRVDGTHCAQHAHICRM